MLLSCKSIRCMLVAICPDKFKLRNNFCMSNNTYRQGVDALTIRILLPWRIQKHWRKTQLPIYLILVTKENPEYAIPQNCKLQEPCFSTYKKCFEQHLISCMCKIALIFHRFENEKKMKHLTTYSFKIVRILSRVWQKRLVFSCICKRINILKPPAQ